MIQLAFIVLFTWFFIFSLFTFVLFKRLLPKSLDTSVPFEQRRKGFLNLGKTHLTICRYSCLSANGHFSLHWVTHTHTHARTPLELEWITPKADIPCIRHDRKPGKVSTTFKVLIPVFSSSVLGSIKLPGGDKLAGGKWWWEIQLKVEKAGLKS